MEKLLTEEERDRVFIAGGFAHPELTEQIAASIGTEPGQVKYKVHPNTEIYSRYEDNVRGRHVFVVQSHIPGEGTSVNDAIMQQCLLIDAARSASAREITAVAPYMAYGRQDRRVKKREPVGIRVVLDQLAAAGANRIVTVDLHSPQSEGIFRGPFDHLTAQPALRRAMAEEIENLDKKDCIIVAPDAGAAKLAERHQAAMQLSMMVMNKMRDPNDSQKISRDDKFPDVEGKYCLLFDDMIDTATTLITAAEALKNSGARGIYVDASHGILSDPATENLQDAPLDKIIVTDTYRTEAAQAALGDKLRVISVAPIIGQAIIEIVREGSVSELFDDENHR